MDTTEIKPEAAYHEDVDTPVGLDDTADVEKFKQEQLKSESTLDLKLDKHGLPLVPQPTSHKDDPLVSKR